MDELAAELGVDPLEVRRRNWIKHEEFPYDTIAGLTYDSGNYEAATDKAMELFGYDELRAEQADRARAAATRCSSGIGVSTFTEMCGLAPSRVLGALAYGAGGWEHASVRDAADRQGRGGHRHVRRTGRATRPRGARSPPTRSACRSRTSRCCTATPASRPRAWTPTARGRSPSAASRCYNACDKVIEKASRSPRTCWRPRRATSSSPAARSRCAAYPDQAQDHPGGRAGRVRRARPARRRRADARLRRHLRPGQLLVPARHPPVRGRGRHRDRVRQDPLVRRRRRRRQGRQPADRRGPGARRPRPGHRAGAVRGGGLRRRRQPDRPPRWPTTWCRRRADLPTFTTDRTETPATTNPLGVKGVGEAGTIASTPAVVNAIVDALRPYGVNDVPMPCTPERVWRAHAEAAGRTTRPQPGAGGGLGSAGGEA